jgi:hypothetical protein
MDIEFLTVLLSLMIETVQHLTSDTTKSRLVNTISDKDFEKHHSAFGSIFNSISKSKVEITKLVDNKKVKIPQENGWIFCPTEIL